MSWHYVTVLGSAFSAVDSSDGQPSLDARSTRDDVPSSCNASVTTSSTTSPSGTTSPPSTGDRSVDAWTSSLRASRARSGAKLATPRATRPTSSEKPSVSTPRPARDTCFLRTSGSSRAKRGAYAATSNHGVKSAGRSSSTLPSWVARHLGSDAGFLPTPTQTANHLAPAMAKWPAYRRLQSLVQKIGGSSTLPDLFDFLMGVPIGWTGSAPLGMDSFQQWLSVHSKPSPNPTKALTDEQ